jgi:hypothetical protein
MALKNDGTVVAWGCGNGYNFGQCSVPTGPSGVTAITAGEYDSLALKSNGHVVAWGCSPFYIAGYCTVPTGLSGATAIAATWIHSLAVVNVAQERLTPNAGLPGTLTTVSGTNFVPGEQVTLLLYCSLYTCTSHSVLGTATADATGSFSVSVPIPATALLDKHDIGARGSAGSFARRSFTVLGPGVALPGPDDGDD